MTKPTITDLENTLNSLRNPDDMPLNDFLSACTRLAEEWQSHNRDQKAIETLELVLTSPFTLSEASEEVANIHVRLAFLYRALGNNKKTGSHFQLAVKLLEESAPDTPDLAGVYYHLALFLDSLFLHKPAKTYYQQTLEILSKTEPTHSSIDKIRTRLTELNG